MSQPLEVDVAIIGAGPCGLGAAWQIERLHGKGVDLRYVMLDEQDEPGGSASSVTTAEGFTFDFGGHVLYPHEHYSDLKALLDDLVHAWHESTPVRGVWIDGRLVPYPVQRNIHRLQPGKMLASLVGLGRVSLRAKIASRRGRPPSFPSDLDSHLRSRFGDALTRLVLGPINRKMWAHDPSVLSSSWASQRSGSSTPNVADVSIRQIMRSIVTRRDNPGWTDGSCVRYPARGGSGAIWRSLAERLRPERIRRRSRVIGIDTKVKIITLQSGERVRYAHMISTIPLDALLRMLLGRPHLSKLASELRYSRAHFVGFGLRGSPPPLLDRVHSFHVPQTDIPCWRISFPAAFSPGNVPSRDHWSILCETSSPADEAAQDSSRLAATIEGKLIEYGLLQPGSEIVCRWQAGMEHGYPVPFLGRDVLLQRIHAALREFDILSRGRFGGWKYEVSNQDHTFMQGVEAVDFLVKRQAETTYSFPEAIN